MPTFTPPIQGVFRDLPRPVNPAPAAVALRQSATTIERLAGASAPDHCAIRMFFSRGPAPID
jgi:hypothetical protein